MEKVEQYKIYILEFLEKYVSVKAVGYEMLDSQIIADEKRHHYQLVEVGWAGIEYVHHSIFHFDIKNEKIWIQLNNTDVSITKYLLEKGVPKSDIVIGLTPEYLREETGFAVV